MSLRLNSLPRTALILAVLLAGSRAVVHAQDAQAAATATADGSRWDAIKTRLKLTPDQEAKIRPILQEEAGKLKAVGQKYEGQTSKKAKKAKMKEAKAIQSDAQTRINPFLTEEQKAEWKKMRDEAKAKAKDEMKKRKAAAG